MEELTADLDAEETPFIERLILLNERLLQSGFINSDQAHEDIERLISLLRLSERDNQEKQMATQQQAFESDIHDHIMSGHFGMVQRITNRVLSQPDIADAKRQALAAGVPIWQIITAILPFVLQIISGKPIDIQAIIAAILALFPKPA